MADESDLDAIRARRMNELQSQYGNQQNSEEQQQKAERMAEMKHSILSQVLDQSARTRLNTIAVAKPEKAQMVESMLMQMAQSGQIQGKLNESQLKSLLEKVSEKTQKTTTVKFDRRRAHLDSDSD